MSRKLFFGIMLVVIAALAAWNVSLSAIKNEMSISFLDNIEVMANGEQSGNGDCQIIKQTSGFMICDGYYVMIEAMLDYSCGSYSSGECEAGYEYHMYNCNGSWSGFTGNTYRISCP